MLKEVVRPSCKVYHIRIYSLYIACYHWVPLSIVTYTVGKKKIAIFEIHCTFLLEMKVFRTISSQNEPPY